MPREFAEAFAQGEGTLGVGNEIFVGAADDMAGITSVGGGQQRLALFSDYAGNVPKLTGDALVTFKVRNLTGVGLRSPLETVPPRGFGFTPGGRTGGDAREWLFNNGTSSELGIYDIFVTPLN
jgi:hypothetical protein